MKKNLVITLPVFLLALLHSSSAMSIKTKVIKLEPVKIKGFHHSMEGPMANTAEPLESSSENKHLWIQRVKFEVTDQDGKDASHFLCHATIGPSKKVNGKIKFVGGMKNTKGKVGIPQIGGDQATLDFTLPKGFAVKTVADPSAPMMFESMYLSPFKDADKVLNTKAIIDYYDKEEFKKENVKELLSRMVWLKPEEKVLRKGLKPGDPPHRNGSWHMDPGKGYWESVKPFSFKKDVTVHYLRAHTHPYSEYVELYDVTNSKSIWKGMVKTDLKTQGIVAMDRYSDEKGFKIKRGNKYIIRTSYNNTTDHDINVMATLNFYYR